jgi:hypothetical protein
MFCLGAENREKAEKTLGSAGLAARATSVFGWFFDVIDDDYSDGGFGCFHLQT